MSGDSMTAIHVEHEIATFPGSPRRGGRERPAVKHEAEGLGREHVGEDTDKFHLPHRHLDCRR
jgi:hypothetical protein